MRTEKLKVVYRNVNDLIPYSRNARTHSPSQITKIASSIKEFGWTVPILIDGENGIIAGHGRLEAAKKLGLTEVPTIELKDLSEAQRRAYILADNRLALDAGWDEELLKIELNELQNTGVDLSEIGFSSQEISSLVGDCASEKEELEDTAVHESEALRIIPVSECGTVWHLGAHRLCCGDSTDKDFVHNFCNHADLLLTDPPYGISIVRKSSSTVGGGKGRYAAKKFIPVANDDSSDVGKQVIRIAREITDNQIIFGGNYFASTLPDSQCWIVWDKKNEKTDFADCELAWTSFDKGVKKYEHLWNGYSREGSKQEELKTRIHPNQKPVGLLKRILEDNTNENDVVFDPFGGSGSTLIACERMNRTCYMIELEPRYVDCIIARWQDISGKEATREDGVTYNSLKEKQDGCV